VGFCYSGHREHLFGGPTTTTYNTIKCCVKLVPAKEAVLCDAMFCATGADETRQENREILRWALKVARTPEVYGCHSGLAAYDAWARQIANDDDFATNDVDALRLRYEVHNTAVGTVAECRSYAARFLEQMAREEPAMAGELLAAEECYDKEHDLMYKVWGLVGGNGHPQAHIKFAEPGVREKIVAIIHDAKALDEKAVGRLEMALGE